MNGMQDFHRIICEIARNIVSLHAEIALAIFNGLVAQLVRATDS